jgi:hypothetical protein
MVDRHGRWRIPTNGGVTKTANAIVKSIPRLDGSFVTLEDTIFDMDNEGYLESNIVYIILFGVIGIVISFVVFSILIGRYCCNCCGGKDVRRKGYPENQINFFRYAIIIISFFLEAILIYGYFANTDLHNSLSALTDSFANVSRQILDQMRQINLPTEPIPDIPSNLDINLSIFQEDFEFSARYASGQADSMKSFLDKFETWRMIIIIANLVSATFGCSLGIAAGSVRKGTPVLIMVILFTVADLLFFFSFGIHFAGSKIIYDFCSEIDNYINDDYDDMIPMRLQYFIPCVNSPVFPFVKNNFYFNGLTSVNEFNALAQGLENFTYPADWTNITEYKSLVDKSDNAELKTAYGKAENTTKQMTIIEQSVTCRWSRNELKLDKWLLCTYAKDNLDMIMLTQLAGCVVLFVLTVLGIPAIKRFKFAGNANLGGILDGNKGFMNKHAKAKR